jgi:hypothetical protein
MNLLEILERVLPDKPGSLDDEFRQKLRSVSMVIISLTDGQYVSVERAMEALSDWEWLIDQWQLSQKIIIERKLSAVHENGFRSDYRIGRISSMDFEEREKALYDDNVKIHLACLQLLAEKNLLRFESIDLGKDTYRGLVPEKDSRHFVYWRSSWPERRLIVGMVCPTVRESKVKIVENGRQLHVTDFVPMASIALPIWYDPTIYNLWPGGWLIEQHGGLNIEIIWDGKEKPGDLVLVNLCMLR